VIKADRIFVIVGGRIEQVGSYEELSEIEGPFREMVRRQALQAPNDGDDE
jgi:ABC-type multidrug transport system fused ATPase/permease subunit